MQNVTPSQPVSIIEIGREPSASIDMIQVTVAAFGITGWIMASAVVAGLLAGALYIWYRGRGPASTIEARGYQHNFFRAE
ncbi:MAG TPA: hypothetical protein VNJ02_07785 [Vicinamibacterales bacterium]|nr:hypothetical protein [Vicinamibacterales bacterium]